MYEVTQYDFGGAKCRTRLWWAEKVQDAIGELDGSDRNRFLRKLEHYARTGFEHYIGEKFPIRHEWDGVYRIGMPSSLFRIVGFFEDNTKRDFIAIDAFLKTGTKLKPQEQARIDEVARVRHKGDWHKKESQR